MGFSQANRHRDRVSAIGMLAAAAGLALASCAFAQAREGQPPVLKGPEARQRDVPGVTNTFGQGQAARRMAERIPPEVFRDALAVLIADNAPEAIRATPEQEERIRGMAAELRTAMREYMAEHREELMQLRREANLSGRGAEELDRAIGRPRPGEQGERGGPQRERGRARPEPGEGRMSEAATEKQEVARQRLRELMAAGPRIEDSYTRIWETLSADQRKAVDARLDEFREREAARREEMYVRQRVGERERGGPEGDGPRRPAADAAREQMTDDARPGETRKRPAAAAAERRERLIAMFERLSPEQQEMLLERLANAQRDGAFRSGGPGAQRGPREGERGRAKPAPAMDDVDVPSPDEVEKDARPRRRKQPD